MNINFSKKKLGRLNEVKQFLQLIKASNIYLKQIELVISKVHN